MSPALLRRIGLSPAIAGIAASLLVASTALAARHALLVGCANYPALTGQEQLLGPKNDVALLERVLVERYRFVPASMTILTENGKDGLPTRENIHKGFVDLAQRAKPGDAVLILLAGHGSQQPVGADNDWIKNYQPDGMDPVFCPRDVLPLEGNRSGRITNGIVDDEIGAWLRPILAKGAFVWLLVDACHSTAMIRGNGAERIRALPAARMVPQDLIADAQKRAKQHAPPQPEQRPGMPDRLVALYACQASETAPEGKYPPGAENAEEHGLLSFAVARALTQRRGPITYRELAREIQSQYAALNHRTAPVPMLEGPAQDHVVLDESGVGGSLPIQLTVEGPGGLRVNSGAIHGLTPGSVLAVYPPPGEPEAEKVLGHVKVTKAQVADALVEPCEYGDAPLRKLLPEHARCEVVLLDFDVDRLKFAVDDRDAADKPVEAALHKTWCDQLRRIANQDPRSLVRMVDDPRQAQWLVRLDGAAVRLVPGEGWPLESGRGGPPALRPTANTADPYQNVKRALEAIARATNLVQLASEKPEVLCPRFGQDLHLDVKLLWGQGENAKNYQPLAWEKCGQTIPAGAGALLEIVNNSPVDVDVTAFYVDSHYGIAPVFPAPGSGDWNRLAKGDRRPIAGNIDDKTLGTEYFIVLAVRSEAEQPVDLSALGQDPLEEVVAHGLSPATLAAGRRGKLSPLEELLSTALDGRGTTRGYGRSLGQYSMKAISFQVVPAKRDQ
jgi:hypothetical protein